MKHTDERSRPAPPPSAVEPVRLVDRFGRRVEHPLFTAPDSTRLAGLHRAMVIGRRFNQQASALARQGRLAVYPSSTGQEASQVGGVLALSERDWLFPSYRDSVALVAHGVDPAETLTLFRGGWHAGYDPHRYRCAPQCTPLATNASHAVGLTYAARSRGRDVAALALMGDGATSEGDAHEAYDFAAVWNAPVVFLVRNDHWAVSAPLHRGTAAQAHRDLGHGMKGYRVDGGDAAAVYAVVSRALAEARAGGGPSVVEAVAYREGPGADAPRRHPDGTEAERWRERDPITRLEALLREECLLGDPWETERALAGFAAEAEGTASVVRMALEDGLGADALFRDAYSTIPPLLERRRRELADELREV